MKKIITQGKCKRLTLKPYRVWLVRLQDRIARATSLEEAKDAHSLLYALRQRLIVETTDHAHSKNLMILIDQYSTTIICTGTVIKMKSPRNLFITHFYNEKKPLQRASYFSLANKFNLLGQCIFDTMKLCRTDILKDIIYALGEGYGFVGKLQHN